MSHERQSAALARRYRAARVRAKIRGTAVRPRLNIFRSLRHISLQLIDDAAGKTLLSLSDRSLKLTGTPVERARAAGKALAEQAKTKGITAVVLDRGRYLYHGRVRAVAEGARDGGLKL